LGVGRFLDGDRDELDLGTALGQLGEDLPLPARGVASKFGYGQISRKLVLARKTAATLTLLLFGASAAREGNANEPTAAAAAVQPCRKRRRSTAW